MMMSYFIILLFLLLGSTMLTILLHKRIEVTIPSFFFFIIIYLFILGFFIPLNYLSYFLIFLVSILFLYALVKWKRENLSWIKEYLFSKTLLVFIVSYILICIMNMGKNVAYIDEYTHWADVVKAMFQTNQISIYQESLWYASYPPGVSLLQYFFMILNGAFKEDILYIINQTFMISLFLPFLTKKHKKWNLIPLLFVILISPMIFVRNYYDMVYVDAYLGILFAHNLAYIFKLKKLEWFDIIYLTCSFITLTLIKDIGIFFALFNLLFLFLMHFKSNRKLRFQIGLITILTIGSRLLFSFALSICQVTLKHQNTISITEIIRIFTLKGSKEHYKIIENFIERILSNNIITSPINLNYIGTLAIFFAIFYLFKKYYLKDKNQRIWFDRIRNFLTFGAIIYLIGLLIMYLFQMNPADAVDLSSYDRYIVIFLNGIFFFLIFAFLEYGIEKKRLIALLIIFICFMPMYQVRTIFKKRDDVVLTDIIKLGSEINPNSKLVIYNDDSRLYEHARVHYYIRPYILRDHSFVNNIDKLFLNQYDYLYVQHSSKELNSYLIEHYHIKVEDKCLYKIEQNNKLVLQKKY